MEVQDNLNETIIFLWLWKEKLISFSFLKRKKGFWGKRAGFLQKRCQEGEEEQSGQTHSVGATGAGGRVVMESPAGETWHPGSRPLGGHLLRWLVVAGRPTPRSCDLWGCIKDPSHQIHPRGEELLNSRFAYRWVANGELANCGQWLIQPAACFCWIKLCWHVAMSICSRAVCGSFHITRAESGGREHKV